MGDQTLAVGHRDRAMPRSRAERFMQGIVRWPKAVAMLLLTLLFLGCGEKKSTPGARLEGRVSIDGTAIMEGHLQFVPLEAGHGAPVFAAIKDGHYVAPAVPLGKLQVMFSANKKTGRTIKEYSEPYDEVVSIIPPQYQSGLPITVTGDNPAQNFELRTQ